MQIRNFSFICCPVSGSCIIMEPVRTERAVDSAFANSLYFAGSAFARAVDKLAAECWKPSGLTPSQGTLLLHLIDNYEAFSYFISSDLRVNPSSITRLADQLQTRGLIERFTEDHWTWLCATKEATDLQPVLEQCEKNFVDRCADLLGKNAALTLAGMLNQATDKLTGPPKTQIVGKQTENKPKNTDLERRKSN
jgi:MarR family transcriptional regulator, organic hydroperoxide resistance regulator